MWAKAEARKPCYRTKCSWNNKTLKIVEAWRQLLVIKGKVGAIITFKSKVRMTAKSPQSTLDVASVVLRMAVEDHHVKRALLPD